MGRGPYRGSVLAPDGHMCCLLCMHKQQLPQACATDRMVWISCWTLEAVGPQNLACPSIHSECITACWASLSTWGNLAMTNFLFRWMGPGATIVKSCAGVHHDEGGQCAGAVL